MEGEDGKKLRCCLKKSATHYAQYGGRGCEPRDLDHSQYLRHLTLAGARVEEPRGREQDAVDRAERGQSHENWYRPCHHAEQSIGEGLRTRAKNNGRINLGDFARDLRDD